MPVIKSAMKHMRSDARKAERNQTVRSELKTLYKKIVSLIGENPEQAKAEAKLLASKLDKAAQRNIIPKQRAGRKKSRLAVLISKLK